MRLSRLLVLVVPLLLAACGLSDQQKADYARVQQSGVSSAIYDKMVHGDALSLSDIKALHRAGVSDGIVIRYIRDQRTIYYLSASDVENLRKAGVSESVIDFMLQSSRVYGVDYYPYGPYWNGPYWGYPYPYWGGFWWGGYGYRRWH